ncbi:MULTISPECIES: cell division protein ZapC [unclassified Gilliamella]|jgi:cell division protein ZapC|uniref:cell division protein ZapC n=1 Tax=unclassified Gilliamella TaxID=2685620 RepID=UPI00068E53F0|nr:cell division protein ZapC [Gilliamella apicola]
MKMTFRPTDCWRWYFDNQYDSLMLEVSNDMLFRCCYSSKMLIPDVFREFPFSVSDATAYYQFYDSCQFLNLTESQKIELSINAIIAANFIKPQMPKSWYFSQQPMLYTPKTADIVKVNIQDGGKKVYLMVVEAGEKASLCVIAQPTFMVMNKTFYFSEVIKVMNDRLAPLQQNLIDKEISSLEQVELEAIS